MPSEKGPEHQETAPKVNDQEGEKIVFQITEGDIFRATNNIFPSRDREIVYHFLEELGIELPEATIQKLHFVQREVRIRELDTEIRELEKMLNLRYPMPKEEMNKRQIELSAKKFERSLLKREEKVDKGE
jgi:hypothetical protein